MTTAAIIGHEGNLGPSWKHFLEETNVTCQLFGKPEQDLLTIEGLNDIAHAYDTLPVPNIVVYNAAIDNPPGTNASFWGNVANILQVNLIAFAAIMERWIGQYLMEVDAGRTDRMNIVYIGSMLGFVASNPTLYPVGFDKPWAYGASKAAAWNLIKNINVRWSKKGCVATMLALSAVEGSQSEEFKRRYYEKIPIGRMLKPRDFRNAFWAACTATVPYDTPIFVGGGYTIW